MNKKIFGILIIMFSPLIAYTIYGFKCFINGSSSCNEEDGIFFSFLLIATIPIGIVLLIGEGLRKNNVSASSDFKEKSFIYKFFYGIAIIILAAMLLTIFYFIYPLFL